MSDMPPVEPPPDSSAFLSSPHLLLDQRQLKLLRREGWTLHSRGWIPATGDTVASADARHWPGVVEGVTTQVLFTTIRQRICVRWPDAHLPRGFVADYHPHSLVPIDSWRRIVGEHVANLAPAAAPNGVVNA
jgi:hypothetical protein